MTGDLIPYAGGLAPTRGSSRASRQIEAARTVAIAREDALEELAKVRIRNGLHLLECSVMGLAMVDGLINTVSHDRPGLEMTLRVLQQDVAIGIGSTIREYIQR
jgi:hypothetical protein